MYRLNDIQMFLIIASYGTKLTGSQVFIPIQVSGRIVEYLGQQSLAFRFLSQIEIGLRQRNGGKVVSHLPTRNLLHNQIQCGQCLIVFPFGNELNDQIAEQSCDACCTCDVHFRRDITGARELLYRFLPNGIY